jgi:hypothetical protein
VFGAVLEDDDDDDDDDDVDVDDVDVDDDDDDDVEVCGAVGMVLEGVLEDGDALAVQTGAQIFVRRFRLRKSSRTFPSDPPNMYIMSCRRR